MDIPNDNNIQAISNNSTIPNNNVDNTLTTNKAQPNDQSTVSLQQFSMITKELKNFIHKVPGDITMITQAYNVSQ